MTSHWLAPMKTWFALTEDDKKREQICLATSVRARDLRAVFSRLGALASLPFDAIIFSMNAHKTRQSHRSQLHV